MCAENRAPEIAERLKRATPGPWGAARYLIGDERVRVTSPSDDDRYNLAEAVLPTDAELIANAPADLAYLLAELESANRRLAEAWGVGYWQGVDDERQSQDYDGGFTGPNRANPYRAALNQGGGDHV